MSGKVEYYSFNDLIAKMQSIAATTPKTSSGALELVSNDAELREKTETTLAALGVKAFHSVGCGKDAFVARISGRQVVRISSRLDVEPLSIPQVLQPVFSTVIKNREGKGLRLEILPYLKRQDISQAHKEAVCVAISKRGFYFTDPKMFTSSPAEQNVMLLPDGTPVNVDREAAARTTNDPFVHEEREQYNRMRYPNYKWEGKQEQFFPELKTCKIIAEPLPESQTHKASFAERVNRKNTITGIEL